MPGGNGRALAERLVTSMTDLKVLYTSGYTDSIATLQAIRASSAAFIQKPYSPDALARSAQRARCGRSWRLTTGIQGCTGEGRIPM